MILICFSDCIKDELECGFLASEQHTSLIENKQKILEGEICSLIENLEAMFMDSEDRIMKIKKAMVYEANERLVGHPFDLIGLRRLKLFEDCLKTYVKKEEVNTEQCHEVWKKMKRLLAILQATVSHYFGIKSDGFKNSFVKVLKIIVPIVVITVLVTGNDYAQDFNVVKAFWAVGSNGLILDSRNKDYFSAIILLKFYPLAMFLTVVMTLSSILAIFHFIQEQEFQKYDC